MMHQCSLPSDIHTAKCCIYILHVHNILRTAACQIYLCFMPFLFAVWQEIVFHARLTCEQQTHFLKQNFSETITPIDSSCMLLLNLSINPVVC